MHSRNFVAFCENCFCRNLKTVKVTFLEKKSHKESIKKSDFWLQTVFLRNRQKLFLAHFF